MITVSAEFVDRTVDELGSCGGGGGECVVFWLAAQTDPTRVLDVVHPVHSRSRFGYSVEDRWLTEFFFRLADERLMAIAQVHTHPNDSVGHSETDDEFVLVPSPGFISIVLPDFGCDFDRARARIHTLQTSGDWVVDPTAVVW